MGKELLSLAYSPKCSIDVYQLSYETVGARAEAAKASGALMIPTGSDPACQGPLPMLLYAHGTTWFKEPTLSRDHTERMAWRP